MTVEQNPNPIVETVSEEFTEQQQQCIDLAKVALFNSQWEVGEQAYNFRQFLGEDNANSDLRFAEQIDQSRSQVATCRRVFEKFDSVSEFIDADWTDWRTWSTLPEIDESMEAIVADVKERNAGVDRDKWSLADAVQVNEYHYARTGQERPKPKLKLVTSDDPTVAILERPIAKPDRPVEEADETESPDDVNVVDAAREESDYQPYRSDGVVEMEDDPGIEKADDGLPQHTVPTPKEEQKPTGQMPTADPTSEHQPDAESVSEEPGLNPDAIDELVGYLSRIETPQVCQVGEQVLREIRTRDDVKFDVWLSHYLDTLDDESQSDE